MRNELVNTLWKCAPAMAARVLKGAPYGADREDIQSAAIVALLQQLPLMNHAKTIRDMQAYGYGVMRNAMRHEVKKLYRGKSTVQIENREPASDDGTESRIIEHERCERAEAALAAMPKQAAILRARYGDGDRGRINSSTYRHEQRALGEIRERVAA